MKTPTSQLTIPSFILIAADRYPLALAAYLKRRMRRNVRAADSVSPAPSHEKLAEGAISRV